MEGLIVGDFFLPFLNNCSVFIIKINTYAVPDTLNMIFKKASSIYFLIKNYT